MNTTRKRPGFNKEDSCLSFLGGAILFLTGLTGLGSILGFIFIDKKTFIDLIYQPMTCLFSLGLVSFGVLIFLFGFSAYKDKKNWFSNATKAQTTIVNRTEASQEDQDGRLEKYWGLSLKILPSQSVINPEQDLVWVDISQWQYIKYAKKSIVHIWYSNEDPFVFLLEDEV